MSKCIKPLTKKGGRAKLNICCLPFLFVQIQILFNQNQLPNEKSNSLICSEYLSHTKNSTIISTNNLVAGLYYVYLDCNRQVLATEKLIIMH